MFIKKLINCGDGDEAWIPKPIRNGDGIQFLIPVEMNRVMCKYMRVEDEDEEDKTRPHPAPLSYLFIYLKMHGLVMLITFLYERLILWPAPMYCGNMRDILINRNAILFTTTKHIDIDCHFNGHNFQHDTITIYLLSLRP